MDVGNFSTFGMHQEKLSATTMMIEEYLLSRSEDSLFKLQRHLTLVESSDDAPLHDTSSMKGVQFFNKLLNLLVAVESSNPLVWSIISILQKACSLYDERHQSTLGAMFVPVLGRLLSENLTLDKKLKLLGLLQVLTCGIEIQWHVPYLQPMLQNVSANVMSADPKEASLSMSIVVNLLHRNPPARHAFLRCIKTKDFLKQLLHRDLKSLEFRLEVSKFMMLMADLSDFHADPKEVKKFVGLTFQTVLECVQNGNVSLVQQTVNFFEDAIQMEKLKPMLLEYPSYVTEIESILKVLEEDGLSRGCESMLLTLLGHLVSLHPPKIHRLLERIVFVSSKIISSGDRTTRFCTLNLLLCVSNKSIVQTTPEWEAVNVALERVMPMLVALLIEPIPRKETTTLLQLLCEFTKVPVIKREMISLLDINVLRAFLEPFISEWQPSRRAVPVEDATFYVQVLVLISEFVPQDSAFLQLYSYLTQQNSVLFAVATALKFGPTAIKYEILKFPSVIGFSNGSVFALAESLGYVTGTAATATNFHHEKQAYSDCPEVFGVAERSRLEGFLSRLEQSQEMPISALMSVLQYRTDADARELRLLNASLEVANSRIVHLLQQVEASKDEMQLLRFGLLDLQMKLEQCKVERDGAIAAEAAAQENASRAFKASEEKVRRLEAKQSESEKTIEAYKKMLEDKNTEIQKLTASVQTLSQDLHNLQERHKNDLRLLVEREEEIKEKTLQINQLELIKNAINEITSGKKKVEK